MRPSTFILPFAIFLASCSSIKSVQSPNNQMSAGLSYYMPKKDFLVKITVTKNAVTAINLGATSAYPDLTKQYVLQHGWNVLGKNTLDVSINDNGLLTSSKSTTVSGVSDAFKNLATSYGQLHGLSAPSRSPTKPPAECSTDGDHTFKSEKEGIFEACGIHIEIKKIIDNSQVVGNDQPSNERVSGVFYRQNEAYVMTATGGGLNASSIVFSPSDSKTHFLPISKTFFSNNEADFMFVDGVPTQFKQDTDGEAVALLKLPADIIGAYFAAVGQLFDAFKTNDQKQIDQLNQSLTLEVTKKKYEACLAAIQKGDEDLMKKLECK